ncbi:mitochondrial carrier domain-containing protein [Rhodotorula diobovata]|uniref:Mitochondrial carrier domain-containing protein n=1 Tax=Rhodotorula diobovata TaxID=5288 RepID=A0A5C5FRY7_9BASI|nr:mitochondrial carrier domain-containing protein [Rhodotorula diobovata]
MTSTLPPLAQATSGSLGAVVSNALIYPLDTVTTRLQASRKRTSKGGYSSIPAAISTIFRTEGLAAFYSGLGPDSLSTLLSQFLYFFVYSALRDRFQARKASRAPPTAVGQGKAKGAKPPVLSAVEELAIGCLAGVVAKGAVSPLSMITVRAQTSSEPRQEVVGGKEGDKRTVEDSDSDDDEGGYGRAPSALALAKEIYEEQGIAGFWSGFQSTIILTLNPAITFYAFATLKRALIPAKHREHPTPTQTFFSGALASAIASAVTYPLILAKTRLQFKSPTGRALYRSQLDVFRRTLKKQGIKGLYQGCESQLLKGFLSEGVKLVVKDRIELLIVLAHRLLVARGKIPANSSM